MRLISALFVIVVSLFSSNTALARECVYEKEVPSTLYIEATEILYPKLADDNQAVIAGILQTADEYSHLAKDSTRSQEAREFSERAEQALLKMVTILVRSYAAIPEMELTAEKMKFEKENGLKSVSEDLEPQVRAVARTLVSIGLDASRLSLEFTKLSADITIWNLKNAGEIEMQNVLSQLDRTLCTFESTNNILQTVVSYVSNALMLAAVKHLNY